MKRDGGLVSSGPLVEIRAARPEEASVVLQFIRELADYERLTHEVVATEETVRATLFGPNPAAEAVFACVNGEPLGFALFFQTYSTFLARPGIHLEDLFVKPAARGRGLGRALLVHLAQLARARGCGRLEWAVLDWNEPAIRFYRDLGARPVSGWTVYRVEDTALDQLARSNRGGS